MKMDDLLAAIPDARLPPGLPVNAAISGVSADSRHIEPGCVFVAIAGTGRDGRTFAAAALAAGAWVALGAGPPPPGVPPERWIRVENDRTALANLACAWHRHPSRALRVFGVTGTNGKTTVATLLQAILNAAGLRCGLLSTVQCDLGSRAFPATHTTPDPLALQAYLASMRDAGCRAASMEVSSHALDQRRIDGIRFEAAAFTNLTQDHLDYHGTLEDYARAKRRIFAYLADPFRGTAVINGDDAVGRQWIGELRGEGIPTLSFGFRASADVRAVDMVLDVAGARFRLVTPWGEIPVSSPLLGTHNVSNALAVAALAGTAGISPHVFAETLSRQHPVRGRLERVRVPGFPAALFVDYAHTPDGLEQVLRALRPLTADRLIVVFGCGGDRDRGKRPLMGRIAAEGADLVVLTSDNPRTEPPESILEDVLAGIPANAASRIIRQVDRREAIRMALRSVRSKGDVVLVAGKGHETTQTLADGCIPFDDREELLRLAPVPPGFPAVCGEQDAPIG